MCTVVHSSSVSLNRCDRKFFLYNNPSFSWQVINGFQTEDSAHLNIVKEGSRVGFNVSAKSSFMSKTIDHFVLRKNCSSTYRIRITYVNYIYNKKAMRIFSLLSEQSPYFSAIIRKSIWQISFSFKNYSKKVTIMLTINFNFSSFIFLLLEHFDIIKCLNRHKNYLHFIIVKIK